MDEYNIPLLRRFESLDKAELIRMRDSLEPEGVNLDYKLFNDATKFGDSERKNLAKCLSGFANSAGGIVLWGVSSDGGKKDRSRFVGLSPWRGSDSIIGPFTDITSSLTEPPVAGVRHEAICVDGGFVIKTLVPASDHPPHRVAEENGQYYRRHGDRFLPMWHIEIADCFGRRLRPKLELVLRHPHHNFFQHDLAGATLVSIRNAGRGIARFPALELRPEGTQTGLGDRGLSGAFASHGLPFKTVAAGDRRIVFCGSVSDVIHPDFTLDVTHLGFPDAFRRYEPMLVGYSLFASDMPEVRGVAKMTMDGLQVVS